MPNQGVDCFVSYGSFFSVSHLCLGRMERFVLSLEIFETMLPLISIVVVQKCYAVQFSAVTKQYLH